MGGIIDAMRITGALNHVSFWNYLLLPLALARFYPCHLPNLSEFRGNVLRAVPTTPCSVQGQLVLLKRTTTRQLTKRIQEQ